MHTLWKGSISFGLVNIPVKMHAATEAKELQFHYLHEPCRSRIRYIKKCPHCGAEVSSEEVVKGYEYEQERYVVLTDEELAEFAAPASRSIDILDFINLQEIDPIYYQKSYYLSPEETAHKAYRLLCVAMAETGRVALARFTLRSKQHLACLRVFEQGLVMETMFYPEEIRHMDAVWQRVEPTAVELTMARQLIDNLVRPFDPSAYRDEARERLAALIESKVAGENYRIEVVPQQGKVLDLMEALRASIALTEKEKGQPGTLAAQSETAETVNPVAGTQVVAGEGSPPSALTPRQRRGSRAKGA